MTYVMRNRQKNWRARRSSRFFRDDRKYGLIAKVFFKYRRIASEVVNIRGEQGYYQSGNKEGGGSSNHAFISDPTAQIALKHIRKIPKVLLDDNDWLENPEDWMIVVEKTLEYFKSDVIVYGVLTKRYLENKGWGRVCTDLDISKDVFYQASNAGLQYARECAIQLGLIQAF